MVSNAGVGGAVVDAAVAAATIAANWPALSFCGSFRLMVGALGAGSKFFGLACRGGRALGILKIFSSLCGFGVDLILVLFVLASSSSSDNMDALLKYLK